MNIEESLSNIIESAGLLLISSIGGRVLKFCAYIALARTLAPSNFGNLMYTYVLVNMISQISVLGIPEGVSRQIAASKPPLEIIRSGLFMLLSVGILLSTFVYYCRFKIAQFVNVSEISTTLGAFSILLLLIPISSLCINILRGYEYSRQTAISRDIAPFTIGLLIFSVLVLMGDSFIGGIAYWICLPLTTIATSLVIIGQEINLQEIFDKFPDSRILSDLFSFSWPLALQSGSVILMTNIDVLAIGYYTNTTNVGYYKAIVPLAQMSLIILSSFVFLYMPVATKHHTGDDYEGVRIIYKIGTKWLTIMTFPFVVFITLFSDGVITVFYSTDYLPAEGALIILTIGMFFRVIVGPNAATVKAIDRTKIDLFSSLSGLIANIILTIILVPTYGLIGAAIATAIGFLLYNLIELAIIYSLIGVQPFSINMIKPLIATSIFGVVLNYYIGDLYQNLIYLILIGVLISFFQVFSLYLTKSFQKEDLILVNNIENKTGLNLTVIKNLIV